MSLEMSWKNGSKVLLVAAAALVFSGVAGAQEIQQRKDDQQDRIAQGVQSGQLTPHETANLENKESGLNHEEHNMRAADDGHLTGADRARLNRQQNHLSRNIYRDKHNERKD